MSAASLRCAIVWAVSPYVPQAPFRIWGGPDQPVATIESALELAQAVRNQRLDPEQTYLAPGKLGPILLLQDRPRRALPEFAALRIIRLEELASDQQERIRSQREPSLFYLKVNRAKYGMTKESAVDINALLRIHESAIAGAPIGRLDASEMRVIGERLIEHLDIDVTALIERRIRELRDRLAAGGRLRPSSTE